jgi:prefoldin subunit 5
MNMRDLARELARLREELEEVGDDYPQLERRIEALTSSIELLQSDLARMREERQAETKEK